MGSSNLWIWLENFFWGSITTVVIFDGSSEFTVGTTSTDWS